ncbi:L-fucose:H+ symporter permease [Sphingobium lactosutens]|uniref:Major facilitator superfamily (MFS) profile domain-containing protein n=1 Tax=Sphingobium lactosutens DS20 TaxID=1331060 RepID=T0HIL3_9SPHN|nr:L-fucose:H+ symporter permease [Sphingobium lactosutens]EQB12832.1 hypothetical protein RLDS_18835 [Sphingobium lactosutens DS20]
MIEAPQSTAADREDGEFVHVGFRWSFCLIVSLFLLWALANNLNDVLVRQFQKSLGLNRAQAGFIQFVFYIGYFVVALPAGLLMRKLGYKAGIILGLGLYAIGALLFYPASLALRFDMFLFALFVIAAGAACLETAANAYIGFFGSRATAVQRLNLAQAFNGLGGCVAPAIGGMVIFSGVEYGADTLAAMSPAQLASYRMTEAATVQMPYMLLALASLIIGIAVYLAKMPSVKDAQVAPLRQQMKTLWESRALKGAVAAQFFYVGAQVGIWSFFIDFVKDSLPWLTERQAAFLLSGSLILFMVGRFSGTILMTRIRPCALLGCCAVANILLCGLAALCSNWLAVSALVLTSFFMSIMFPTIFAMGVANLGAARPLGSSMIIMAVIGGAILPPIMGFVGVTWGSIAPAMMLPGLCFVIIAIYAQRTMLTRHPIP